MKKKRSKVRPTTSKRKKPTQSSDRHRPSDSQTHEVSQLLSELKHVEGDVAGVIRTMREKVRQLESLTRFSGILNSTLDPRKVRERALEATCQLLGCETASLLLVDPDRGDLYWETALGDSSDILRTMRLPINDRSIAGYVAMTGETLVINDVDRDTRHQKKTRKKTGFVTRNMLCIPLTARGRVIGVLQALNKLPSVGLQKRKAFFSGDDLDLCLSLGHQVSIAVDSSQLYTRLKRNFYDTVEALAEAIEKKDRYTGGHTKRVIHYSMCIAKYMNLTEEELERVRLGAVLHDVGKIGIEDKILKKPSELNDQEWPVMKTHPELGYQIMKRVRSLKDVIGAMRYHHERWDGKGYPLGMQGEEIPVIARIVAIADTYDAMVSTRPYRKGLDPQIAYDEIVKNSGTQFCPRTVQAFIQAFENEKMGQKTGRRHREREEASVEVDEFGNEMPESIDKKSGTYGW